MKIADWRRAAKDIRGYGPLVILTTILLLTFPAATINAQELPLFVMGKVSATMGPDWADRLIIEEYDGTLAIKGLVWEGEASWYEYMEWEDEWDWAPDKSRCWEEDLGDPIHSADVRIRGVLLTEGTPDDYFGNPGILWLEYTFTDEAGETVGTGDGFVTLEAIEDLWGAASYQGTIRMGEKDILFSGTGETEVPGFIYHEEYEEWLAEIETWYTEALAHLEEEYQWDLADWEEECGGVSSFYEECLVEGDCDDPVPGDCDEALAEIEKWYERAKAELAEEYAHELEWLEKEFLENHLSQYMSQTVLTGEKPGFDFETAKRVPQLDKMFRRAKKSLRRAKVQRKRVIEEVNVR